MAIKITVALLNKIKKAPLETLKSLSEDDIAAIIQKANTHYHSTDAKKVPLFSDALYDMIKEHLEGLNPNHPVLKDVGARAEHGKKETLPYYMGSLDKIKNDEKAIEQFAAKYPGSYIVSDKLDGNSAMLHRASQSSTTQLYSRGDGKTGQNITHLLAYDNMQIPLILPGEFTIRGELIISKKDFEKVKDLGANARNMVSGLVNAKTPNMKLANLVQFVGYEVITPKMDPEHQYKYMKDLGLMVAYNEKLSTEKLTVDELSKILINRRDVSKYEIDGIVVYHNAKHNRVNDENPKHAFAFKSVLTMQKAEVTVNGVEWNMSKDGYMIPVITFNPVQLAGVSIKRAHGFNGKFILDNKIGPGSKIIIMRSGDVIPYVTEILTPSDSGEAQMPEVKYTWTKTGVDIIMDAADQNDSDELRLKNLIYFFEKIDVKGLSAGNITKMYNSGLKTVQHILEASTTDLLKVDGFKEKMAEKMVAAIKERKDDLDCIKVMNASNTLGRGIGQRKLELILEAIPAIATQRYIPKESEMLAIKGIEKTTASLFIGNLPNYFKFVDANGIKCSDSQGNSDNQHQAPPPANKSDSSDKAQKATPSLASMKIVFTGFRNEKLEKIIKAAGGSVSTSVSKNTTLVIKKSDEDNESGKVIKAIELGVEVITLQTFLQKYRISV
jgi:DNA ligase (NAD+)